MALCELSTGAGTTRVIHPHGELDLVTIDALRATLADAVGHSAGDVLVDLSDVDHVDIVALSAILAAADSLDDLGRSLRVAHARRDLRRVCALLRAEDILID